MAVAVVAYPVFLLLCLLLPPLRPFSALLLLHQSSPFFLLIYILPPPPSPRRVALSLLPPSYTLLTTASAAGFATAKHLAPASKKHQQRGHLVALLANLKARLLSLNDRLLTDEGDKGLVLKPLDYARAALRECATAMAG